jgi:hypothetical protein
MCTLDRPFTLRAARADLRQQVSASTAVQADGTGRSDAYVMCRSE